MTIDLLFLGATLAALATAVMRAATPIIFASLAGLVSDLAGCLNIALEGIMLMAAFTGVITCAFFAIWFPGLPIAVYLAAGALGGILAAILLALLLGVFHLEFGGDLIVAGVAINILASGITVVCLSAFTGDKGSTASLRSFAFPNLHLPFIDNIPVVGSILNGDGHEGMNILIWLSIATTALISFTLYRTAFGLRLRSVGEAPEAAAHLGISVSKVKYRALALSGLLAGLGGLFLSMGYLTLFQTDMTAGRGYLGLAAVFLGGRHPWGTFLASLGFGAFSVFAAQLGNFGVPSQVVLMLPPAVTIIALVLINTQRARGVRLRTARIAGSAIR